MDIELALDAAHAAAPSWGKTPAAQRALLLNRIADRIEQNLEKLAVIEVRVVVAGTVHHCRDQLFLNHKLKFTAVN